LKRRREQRGFVGVCSEGRTSTSAKTFREGKGKNTGEREIKKQVRADCEKRMVGMGVDQQGERKREPKLGCVIIKPSEKAYERQRRGLSAHAIGKGLEKDRTIISESP